MRAEHIYMGSLLGEYCVIVSFLLLRVVTHFLLIFKLRHRMRHRGWNVSSAGGVAGGIPRGSWLTDAVVCGRVLKYEG